MTTVVPPLHAARPPAASAALPAVSASPAETSAPPAAVSASPVETSGAPATASAAQAETSETASGDKPAFLWRLLAIVALAGGLAVAAIGFAGSYGALKALAEEKGLGGFAPWFPIGVDAGIIVALALDLYLARRGLSWPVLRPVAYGLTAATVWFNANAGQHAPTEDPVAAAMHAVMPILFVVAVEAARHLIIRTAELEAGHDTAGIPLLRWLLSPARTWSMWRRMKLWGLPYSAVVDRERDLRVYRVLLDRRHGSVRKAPSDARLPLKMARYGLTVEEALRLPQAAEERERLRREQEADRRVAEEIRAQERETERRQAELRAAGSVQETEAEVAASTTAAQRRADLEAEVLESATAAEARARQAAAEAKEAEARARKQEADRQAAEEEQRTTEAQQAAAEAEKRAAEAAERAAEAEKRTAEAAERAAEARKRAAEIELHAVEAEEELGLSSKERKVRKVARLVLAEAGGDAERLPLERVTDTLGVAIGTASEYRKAAGALIATGYRGVA